jgi:hypothetical protein
VTPRLTWHGRGGFGFSKNLSADLESGEERCKIMEIYKNLQKTMTAFVFVSRTNLFISRSGGKSGTGRLNNFFSPSLIQGSRTSLLKGYPNYSTVVNIIFVLSHSRIPLVVSFCYILSFSIPQHSGDILKNKKTHYS